MTIEEAIKYIDNMANNIDYKEECNQLAEWLKELIILRN